MLLLNATLTVRANQAGSHQNKGWENFTDAVIRKLSDEKEGLVFILWGRYAQAKESLVDGVRHLVLKAPHPSPFSAHSGFFGCRHFSRAYLRHLFNAGELLAPHLATLHNITFYQRMMREMRKAILDDQFKEWYSAFLARLKENDREV